MGRANRRVPVVVTPLCPGNAGPLQGGNRVRDLAWHTPLDLPILSVRGLTILGGLTAAGHPQNPRESRSSSEIIKARRRFCVLMRCSHEMLC
jgi:hypothetical protein